MAERDVYAHAAVLHPAATMDLDGSDRSDRGLPTAALTSDHPTGSDQPVAVPSALTTPRLAPGAQSVASRASVPALPALPAGLADAVEHALAASAQRTQLLQYAGQSYIIKRTASRPRNLVQSMVLRWLAKRLTGQALPLRTLRLSQGVCGMGGEAIRLTALAKAGVRVPRIVDQGAGHLLLEHCGTSVAALLLNWDASVWRCELPRLARDLAAFHRAGHWHGAAQIKNLTRREGLDFRIDFEEDFGEWLPLAAAQAFDLALFLNSISLRGPIDEIEARELLPVLLDAYLADNPDPQLMDMLRRALGWASAPARLATLCLRLRLWGRRRKGADRLLVMTDAIAARLGTASQKWPSGQPAP